MSVRTLQTTLDLGVSCSIARRREPYTGKMIKIKPPRRLAPSGGATDCVGVDVTEVILACAKPTPKYPQGRSGTTAGYMAHQRAKEVACRPCAAAWSAKSAARKRSLSLEQQDRERKRATENARRRREKNPETAPACIRLSPANRGTVSGYVAHVDAGQRPCTLCREAVATLEPKCAIPTTAHPAGRTGTRAGYMAHVYAQEAACAACRAGYAAEEKRAREADNEKSLRSNLWNKYRLTLEAYQELLSAQGGKCAICGSTSPGDTRANRFHVDHDHTCCPGRQSCGKCVRGLLCRGCNTALGNFGDAPERLTAAAAYLMSRRTEVADA